MPDNARSEMRRFLILGLLSMLAFCGRRDGIGGGAGDSTEMSTAADSMKMRPTQAGGTAGMGDTTAMMFGMRAHMDSMMRLPPDRIKAVVATHARMMSQLMDRMAAEMRGMNMAENGEWNALVDSVREDLAALPRLEGNALADRTRTHSERLNRLMDMHERLMESREGPR